MTFVVEKFTRNVDGRDFVIGDIHGCLEHVEYLMEELKFDKSVDRMFSVGDLVDRGPKSLECLALIEQPWFHAVLGNHEDMMIGELVKGEDCWWVPNGGQWGLEAIQNKKTNLRLKGLLEKAQELPIGMIVDTRVCGKVGICHAESPKDWEDKFSSVKDAIWGRDKVRWSDKMGKVPNGVDMTVHGHTPIGSTSKYHKGMNAHWIDTGCFATGIMLALQIDGDDIQEPMVRKVYIPTQAPGWS